MENVEKDCSVLGNLFQTIINDLRCSSPVWEDFTYKATKLHQCLKTTLVAIGAFLEAFQKVADMATNSRGATKEMGSALTRLCMRHKSIESSLKQLTNSVLDSVVAPLQERLEDWKKAVAQLDKDHAKEYKKARQEIKKVASDTMKLQKKINKGKNEMQTKLDSAMQDVNEKYLLLEEAEKNSVRTALIEERGRFCIFVSCIKPFVDHEVHLMSEVTHLQDIMHSLCMQASDPHVLPASSEQVLADLKGMDLATLSLQGKQHPSPPSSPSSLGSRKSSVCSMTSLNSCSSTSSKSLSPGHTLHKQNTAQLPLGVERLTSVSSQDSGFTSQDTLFVRPTTPLSLNLYQDHASGRGSTSSDAPDGGSTPGTPSADLDSTLTPSSFSTNSLPFSSSTNAKLDRARPHTISAASEKTYARLAVTPELFEPLPEKAEPGEDTGQDGGGAHGISKTRSQSTSGGGHYARPAAVINKMQPVLPPHCPRPRVKAVPPPALPSGPSPDYANTVELHKLAMEKREQQINEGNDSAPTSPKGPQPTFKASELDSSLDLEEAIRSLDSVTAALGAEIEEEEKTVVVERGPEKKRAWDDLDVPQSPRPDKIQQNSLELAEAIRELEASTAALHSTYDTDSHSSLQCSSGYATMDSTPSGSDDTVPPGGLVRRSSMNTQKPPPPVRRTASVSYSSGRPMRPSPPRQQSESGVYPDPNRAGSSGRNEGFYAELQTVQQSIQQRVKSQQQPPVLPKPGQLQRQENVDYPYQQQPYAASSASASRTSSSDSPYAVPSIQSSGSANVMQSLNAKFASLNQQYQDPQYQRSSVSGTYVGRSGDVDPQAGCMMPPPGQAAGQQQNPGYAVGQQYAHSPYHCPHPIPQQGDAGELPPPPPPGEDFPLPPTEEELKEIETLYAKPPPINPKPKVTGDLMIELKRRMSSDEYSNV